jgi:hypothetical protein
LTDWLPALHASNSGIEAQQRAVSFVLEGRFDGVVLPGCLVEWPGSQPKSRLDGIIDCGDGGNANRLGLVFDLLR